MEEIMVKIDNVSKAYKLGQIGGTTLREDLKRKWAKLRKKEDPTRKIGAKEYKSGEKFKALDGVSFEVKRGEAIGLIGHNGAGKSTLLKLITRVTAPTSGEIYLNGRVASMLEVGTGFHRELTGRENIYMNGTILGMTKKEIDKKVDDIIDFSEIRQFIDTPVKRYSSGMYVKLAFSVAAHLDSEIMLMDEVLAVGDMAFQNKCLSKMREVANSGRTIIYVSHNMNTIRQLCDRCVVLNRGKVEFDGGVEEGISKYMGFSEEFKTEYDYKNLERRDKNTHEARLNALKILDKKAALFDCGEEIKFKLRFSALSDVEGINFRFEIFSSNGIRIGTTFLQSDITMKGGKEVTVESAFSTENLAPGQYYAGIYAYKTVRGLPVNVDGVEKAFLFEMLDPEIKWKTNWWGSIRFKPMEFKTYTE